MLPPSTCASSASIVKNERWKVQRLQPQPVIHGTSTRSHLQNPHGFSSSQLSTSPCCLVDLLTNWRPVFLSEVWDVQAFQKGWTTNKVNHSFWWKHPLDSVDVEDFHAFPSKNHLGQFSPQAACKRSKVAIVIHMFWRRSFRAQQDSLGFPNETSRAAGSAKHLALHSVGLLKCSSKYARVQWTFVYLQKHASTHNINIQKKTLSSSQLLVKIHYSTCTLSLSAYPCSSEWWPLKLGTLERSYIRTSRYSMTCKYDTKYCI